MVGMEFSFKNEDGESVQNVMQCQACSHIQISRHFGEDGLCPMCHACDTKRVDEITSSDGLSNFQYRTILKRLEADCTGIGSATIDAIKSEYESGDEFLDACRTAYDEQDWSELTVVSGIGDSTAKSLCLDVASMRDWENGKAEIAFDVA